MSPISIDTSFIVGVFIGSLFTLLSIKYIPSMSKELSERNDEYMFGVIISLIGVIFLEGAFIFHDQYLYGFLAGISGAFIGAGISTVAAKISIKSLENNLSSILQESRKETFYNEETVEDFRRDWHVYHVTSISPTKDINDDYVWRYTIWDFRSTKIPGKLFCYAAAPSFLNEEPHRYKVEGFIKHQGGGLVVCTTRTDKAFHSAGVYLFPLFADKDIQLHYGFCIIKSSWSGKNMVSPCIISNRNILKTKTIGFIEDKDDCQLLDLRYKEINDHAILPRIILD